MVGRAAIMGALTLYLDFVNPSVPAQLPGNRE